jgi:hypothetical protein
VNDGDDRRPVDVFAFALILDQVATGRQWLERTMPRDRRGRERGPAARYFGRVAGARGWPAVMRRYMGEAARRAVSGLSRRRSPICPEVVKAVFERRRACFCEGAGVGMLGRTWSTASERVAKGALERSAPK